MERRPRDEDLGDARVDRLETDQEQTLSELEDSVVERTEQTRGVLRLTGVAVLSLFAGSGAL